MAWLYLLTWTSPSLFSRVSLFPLVLLSELRRSCTPLSHPQVPCSVSSKFCCSCRLSWHMRSLSLAALRSAWCCNCSCADARSSAPLPWPPSLRDWASWHRLSNESLQDTRLENYLYFNLLQLLKNFMKTLHKILWENAIKLSKSGHMSRSHFPKIMFKYNENNISQCNKWINE